MSIFTLEVAGRAAACISAQSRSEAEETVSNPWFVDALLGIEGDGPPLWDGTSEWKLRKATPPEIETLKERIEASDDMIEDPFLTILLPGEEPTPPDHTLILANRVEHTPVFNQAGERIGHIADLSIDRVSGQVVYAIMSFGGFLGIGAKFHPLPWSLLRYDTGKAGYVVPMDREALEAAPQYEASELFEFGGPRYELTREAVYTYYGKFGAAPF